MIGKISGTLDAVTPSEVVLDVNGVGYEIYIPLSTYDQLPKEKEKTSLYTFLSVKEDSLTLYGFATKQEKELFIVLMTVSGIGPKSALKILSSVPVSTLCEAISHGDLKTLTGITGIGKRTAERLILELKNKITTLAPESLYSDAAPHLSNKAEEAALALIQLGFKPETARRSIQKLLTELPTEETNSENLIRIALQSISNPE